MPTKRAGVEIAQLRAVNAPVRITLKVIGVASAITAIALVLAQDQETLRVRSAISATDARFPDYVGTLMGTPVARGGSRYEVLTNGDRSFPAMLEAIRGAKTRISFETYIYSAGTVAGPDSPTALADAARRGVQVKLIRRRGRRVRHRRGSREAAEATRAAASASSTRRAGTRLEEVNYRTHRKILVVDGEIGFTGGVGVADHWLGNAQDKEHWRDTQVRMRGPIVRLLEAGFYENFIETGGEVTPELDERRRPDDAERRASMIVAQLAHRRQQRPEAALPAGDRRARRRRSTSRSPYFVTDESSDVGARGGAAGAA